MLFLNFDFKLFLPCGLLRFEDIKSRCVTHSGSRSVAVITFALHAKGPRFEPGRDHFLPNSPKDILKKARNFNFVKIVY